MLKEVSVIELLKRKEKVNVEMKLAKHGLPQSIFETYVSFCNTKGGIILLGIKEEKTSFSVVGVDDPHKMINNFWNAISSEQKVNRNILMDRNVYPLKVQGKDIIVIEVPRASYDLKPIYVGKNPYEGTFRRNHEGDYRCSKEMVTAMIRDSFLNSNDNEVLENFSLNDLDINSVKAYRNRFRNSNEGHVYDELNDQEFLIKMGVYRKDRARNIEGLTRAGLLMFGKTETFNEIYNHVNLDYRNETNLINDMRWSDRVIENGLWEKNLYNFVTKVYPKIISEFEVPFQMIDSLQRKDESRLHTAAREALVNLVIHADFMENPCNLVVLKKENHIYYSNSGMLRMPIEEVFEGGNSIPRNTTVQRLFRYIGFGESAGTGYSKILAPAKFDGYKIPELMEKDSIRSTILKLWTTKKVIASETVTIVNGDILSEHQKMILKIIKETPGLNVVGITKVSGLKKGVVEYVVRSLREKKLIEYWGPPKTGGYHTKVIII